MPTPPRRPKAGTTEKPAELDPEATDATVVAAGPPDAEAAAAGDAKVAEATEDAVAGESQDGGDEVAGKVPAEPEEELTAPTLAGESAHDAAVASWRRNNPAADLEE